MGKAVKPKWYAIKRPDGTFIMEGVGTRKAAAWGAAESTDETLSDIMGWDCEMSTSIRRAAKAGYRCVEVVGFKEAGE